MPKVRLEFSKIQQGSFISHLDLTRLFTRALTRAKVNVKYTNGFNPHPFIVFTPPLSLGYESLCELVDFEIEDENIDYEKLKGDISSVVPQGIEVVDCYQTESKFKDIGFSEFELKIQNDDIKLDDIEKIKQLFEQPVVEILKKSKKGESIINIVDKIKNISIKKHEDDLIINVLTASSPDNTLNPEYIIKAIKQHLEIDLGFVIYKRLGFYKNDFKKFI